jgi:hypothetical protein
MGCAFGTGVTGPLPRPARSPCHHRGSGRATAASDRRMPKWSRRLFRESRRKPWVARGAGNGPARTSDSHGSRRGVSVAGGLHQTRSSGRRRARARCVDATGSGVGDTSRTSPAGRAEVGSPRRGRVGCRRGSALPCERGSDGPPARHPAGPSGRGRGNPGGGCRGAGHCHRSRGDSRARSDGRAAVCPGCETGQPVRGCPAAGS